MTTSDRDKIMDRLKKLFALADPSRGATENEVFVALKRAKELMARHNLSMAQVTKEIKEDKTAPKISIIEGEAHTRKGNISLKKYEQWLAHVIDELCDTKHLYYTVRAVAQRFQKCRLVFVGEQTDCAVAAQMWNIFRTTIHKHARAYCGKGFTPSHRSYCEGFVARLYKRSRELKPKDLGLTKEEGKSVALVVVNKRDALQQWWDSQQFKSKRKSNAQSGKMDYDAYDKGYEDGGRMDLGRDNRLNPSDEPSRSNPQLSN